MAAALPSVNAGPQGGEKNQEQRKEKSADHQGGVRSHARPCALANRGDQGEDEGDRPGREDERGPDRPEETPRPGWGEEAGQEVDSYKTAEPENDEREGARCRRR